MGLTLIIPFRNSTKVPLRWPQICECRTERG
jgi:hypothetical protein